LLKVPFKNLPQFSINIVWTSYDLCPLVMPIASLATADEILLIGNILHCILSQSIPFSGQPNQV